jgi:hypothetical protein
MTNTIGLFVHYRPVVLTLPTGGCQAVARYLGFDDSDLLQQGLDSAGLLYRHPDLGPAVASLLQVELAETTLGGVLHQSLMQFNALTHRPQVFQWNPEAVVDVEPISLRLDIYDGAELLELDLRMRSEAALLPGAHCPPALISKLKEQGNLWWAYGKGEEMDGREYNSMEPAEQEAWAQILKQMDLPGIQPVDLVKALDEFADCAIDFRYSEAFLQSMASSLSMPLEYLEAWQAEGDGVIVDVGDDKIQGFC